MNERRWLTYGLLGGALVLTAWAASAMPMHHRATPLPNPDPIAQQHPQKQPNLVQIPTRAPRVELVFALDTTGSMSGLLDGAKRKIWSIAQFVAQGNPKPDVRIGLVAYRDLGDDYVTKFYDLSDDLDTVFANLSSFQAGGGGDMPEHVSKALSEAVDKTSWSSDQSTLKQIYLVGDAPPHTDYHDGFDYVKAAKKARAKGIHINTIRCGNDVETAMVWNQIARDANGEFASIEQSGGVRSVVTPYDDKLSSLSGALVDTGIAYGEGGAAYARKAHAAKAIPTAAAADRAAYFGLKGGGGVGGKADEKSDLTSLMSSGAMTPATVAAAPAASLPPEMQAMDGDKRQAYVKSKMAERSRLQAEINGVAKQRDEWLRKNTTQKSDSFDAQVEGALRKQAKSVGLAL